MSGRFEDYRWAESFKKDLKTIHRWVKQYKVPHKTAGSVMIIDANDFWSALPYGGLPEVDAEE